MAIRTQCPTQRPEGQTFLYKFSHFPMAVHVCWLKLAWLTPNLEILLSLVCLCGSIAAHPIIYILVPSPSRFEIRQCEQKKLCHYLRMKLHCGTRHCHVTVIWPNNYIIFSQWGTFCYALFGVKAQFIIRKEEPKVLARWASYDKKTLARQVIPVAPGYRTALSSRPVVIKSKRSSCSYWGFSHDVT